VDVWFFFADPSRKSGTVECPAPDVEFMCNGRSPSYGEAKLGRPALAHGSEYDAVRGAIEEILHEE
jgi:hypothetical protein